MLTDQRVLLFGSLLLILFLFLLYRIQRVKQVWQAYRNLPTYSVFISPLDFLSRLLPRIPWISVGRDFGWENVYQREPLICVPRSHPAHSPFLGVFADSNSDIVHVRSLFQCDTPQLLIADATASRVGQVHKWSFLCSSICPFRLSFKAMWHFPKLLKT